MSVSVCHKHAVIVQIHIRSVALFLNLEDLCFQSCLIVSHLTLSKIFNIRQIQIQIQMWGWKFLTYKVGSYNVGKVKCFLKRWGRCPNVGVL